MRESPETKEYLGDSLNMHKSAFQVRVHLACSYASWREETPQVCNLEKLEKLAKTLMSANPPIPHQLWIEQPENIPTCLAVQCTEQARSKGEKALDKAGENSGKAETRR